MPTPPHTRTTVAGEDATHYFTNTLFELCRHVGIPSPTFTGTLLCNDGILEAWEIKTRISACEDDPDDDAMEYTDTYPDWDYSIDMAMQGAIVRISHRYRDRIVRTSAYYQFGERTEDGEAVHRTETETRTLIHRYEVEREFSIAGMENIMRVQLQGIDGIRDALQDKRHELAKALDLVDSLEKERLALEKYISLIGEPQKMQDEASKAWAGMLETTLKKT